MKYLLMKHLILRDWVWNLGKCFMKTKKAKKNMNAPSERISTYCLQKQNVRGETCDTNRKIHGWYKTFFIYIELETIESKRVG